MASGYAWSSASRRAVGTRDLPDHKLGKAVPYGIYDITADNEH